MMIGSRNSKNYLDIDIDKSVTIYHRHLQVLATELYKVRHGLALELMNNIFEKINVTYNFRKNSTFETRNIKTVYYGSEPISFTGFCQVTLRIQKILPSSNQILNLENMNIVHAVCAGCKHRIY